MEYLFNMDEARTKTNCSLIKASINSKALTACLVAAKRTKLAIIFIIFLLFSSRSFAGIETIPTGSYIINMGVTPQTINNGLKPYGLVYELIKTYNVPVKWVINQTKQKDGIDFTFNGTSYKGGTFIINAAYITAAVQTRINYWITQGVVATATSSAFTVDVTYTFKAAPRWTLDAANGKIAIVFLNNALVPSSAYGFKDPTQLNSCDDIFVMPHADPTWATHKTLYYWNQASKGAIWAGCHAVSVMENINGPDINNPATTRRMNFLMNDGPTPSQNAVSFLNHVSGTPPFNLQFPTHPIMQFIGKTDLAHSNGSEQIYLPFKPGGGWRSSTSIGVYDASDADVPAISDGAAGVIAFGRGFGDAARGWVMYEGGHNIAASTAPDNVAAQRAFFNFSFLAAVDKAPVVTLGSIPDNLISGSVNNVSATATAAVGTGTFTYQWSSSCGGAFANATAASTTFTAPVTASNTTCVITCKVTDNCGRVGFETKVFNIYPSQRPPVCVSDAATLSTTCGTPSITVNVLANDYDPDGDPITATLIGSGSNGTFVNNGNGNISYTPNANFLGTDPVAYQACDNTGRCSTSTLTITVSSPADVNGCNSTQYWGVVSSINALRATIRTGSPTSKDNSIADPDGIVGDNTTYTTFSATSQSINYTLDAALPAAGPVYFYVDASATNRQFTVEQSTDSTTWTNSVTFTSTTGDGFLDATAKVYNAAKNVKWLRVTYITNTSFFPGNLYVDALQYDVYGCTTAIPEAIEDVATMLEDLPVKIDVLSDDADPQGLPLLVTAITVQPKIGKVSINPDGTISYINLKDQTGTGIDSFVYRVCNTLGLCSEAKVYVNIVKDNCGVGFYKPFDFNVYNTNLNPAADSYISGKTTNSNYGSASSLVAKGKNTDKKRALLRFTLGIPAGAIIDSASLSLYKTTGYNESVGIYRLTRAWTESSTTWNKADNLTTWTAAGSDYNTTLIATSNVGTTVATINWNVKSLVQGWVSNTYTNNGLVLRRNPEGSGVKDITFNSNNAATNKPVLFVRYRMPGTCTAIPAYAPFAMPDTAVTNSITPVTVNVTANDYDYNQTGMSVSLLGSTSSKGGSVALSGNSITYTPPVSPAYNGIDTFMYKVCSSSLCDTAMVFVRVTNSAPFANADVYTILTNTASTPNSFSASVMGNDSDPDGNALTAPVITTAPRNGVAIVSGTQIVYTPAANFTGRDTLVYSISENTASCTPLQDTALVVFTINNREPIATGETVTINPCEIKTISVLANDVDPEEGVMTVTIVSPPAIGSAIVINNNTQIQYTAPSGVTNTSTTLTYEVCDNGAPSLCSSTVTTTINIRPVAVNTAPVAARDTFEINNNATLYADVLSNDTDPDSKDLITPVTIITSPKNGTITATYSNGLVAYLPNSNYVGLDSFQYSVCNKIAVVSGCTPATSLCSTSWAYIVSQGMPIANYDKFSTGKNMPVNMNILSNDVFGYYGAANGTISIITAPINGGVVVTTGGSGKQSDNGLRYTPNANYLGIDSLVYQICDSRGNCDTALVHIWVMPDTDGDGVADYVDIDDDNDGIPDYVEVCGAGATAWNCTPNNSDPSGDDDNDGIINYKDADWATLNTAGCAAFLDSDSDGIPDYLDRDSDNDGIQDVIEAGGVDANGDGIIDNFCDTDGDGLSQNVDANNTGAVNSGQGLGAPDFDSDGVPNFKDLDSDNDGIPDIVESYAADINNDGRVDSFADSDGDGWDNKYDGDANGDGIVENLAGVLIVSGADPNYVNCSNPGTGRPTCYTNRGNGDNHGLPNFLDLDSDGDGIADAIESGITTASYLRGMVTTCSLVDGWCSTIKAMASLNLRNTDNIGRPDLYDMDSDNDGITDNVEGQPTSSYVVPTDTDTDGDGIVDVYDLYNGIGGNGITPYDHDNDGIPDYIDTDSDNDAVPDRNEGDTQYQALTQAVINGSGDTDGDGLMDYFDTYNLASQTCLSVYRNVSMSNMGPAGNYSGPTPSGSNVQVVQSTAAAGNRDWRNNAILALQTITFNGSLVNNIASLTWKVENEQQADKYIVQRSVDGFVFEALSEVKAANNGLAVYSYTDNVSSLNTSNVYYRIMQVTKAGEKYYTHITSFNINKNVNEKVSIYPNPVQDVLNISIASLIKQTANVTVSDVTGKVLIQKLFELVKGDNVLQVPEVRRLSKGLLLVRIKTSNEIITEKIIR